ncbi:hypothetical protein J1N35_005901 [Gossypium stocksii]|uniref:Uncharacterized protein n=1 Tax=Gossypium stocksii TaxID=47602 RepID=A0A9D3WET9_9ROSI|nr:hypothetical protein J1N35_005901 [Gossypium stocksii]
MRRRRCREVELVGEVRKYLTSRKVVQKTIHKALKNVKGVETKHISSSSNDHETKAMGSLLREAEVVTSSMFEYLFTLISGPKERSKCGSWALVMSQKMSKSKNAEMLRQLKELELCVQELEDGLECLFRTAKDALLRTKECTQELQSVLHQRRGVEGLGDEVKKYLTSKKEVRKAISKAFKNLKHMDNKLMSKDGETGPVISTLKQVVVATMGVLQSLLSFISGPEASSWWSVVSKLMHQKRVRCEEEEKTNEIANVEAVLSSFIKSGNVKHVENVQNKLQNSELCIQDFEEGLESFFRHLIKAKVTYDTCHHPTQLVKFKNSIKTLSTVEILAL